MSKCAFDKIGCIYKIPYYKMDGLHNISSYKFNVLMGTRKDGCAIMFITHVFEGIKFYGGSLISAEYIARNKKKEVR